MHGSLLHGFKQFVLAREGPAAWAAIADAADVSPWFKATETYPDADLGALVATTAIRWGQPTSAVLEAFGAALVPTLLSLYSAFLDPTWRTLDVLINVESVIHRTVRLRDPKAEPPRLRPRRTANDEVVIEYDSQRRLCAMAAGICAGVAAHFHERITVEQATCMDRGDPVCSLRVRLLPTG